MKTVLFLGRKKWAGEAMKVLVNNNYKVIGAVGMQQFSGSLKDECHVTSCAEINNIPVYSHLDIYHLIDMERQTFDGKKVDIIISYLFPLKIKSELIKIANIAAINFHPAPLPDYQGVGGYNAAIMDELDFYGVTAHRIVERIDAGEILKVQKFQITNMETAYSLEQRSMKIMFELFQEIFSGAFDNMLKHSYRNDVESGRYINKQEFEQMKFIETSDSASVIDKKIRAFWYPPYEGAKVKLGDRYYTLVNNHLLQQIAEHDINDKQQTDEGAVINYER